MDKQAVLSRVIALVREELDACLLAAKAATSAATDPDSKAENKYDTRTLEASYIARGQALRLAELQEALHACESMGDREFAPGQAIALGALVSLANDHDQAHYFLAPAAGGTEITMDGQEILVLTPASPLGQQLSGKRTGDPVTLPGNRKFRITAVV